MVICSWPDEMVSSLPNGVVMRQDRTVINYLKWVYEEETISSG